MTERGPMLPAEVGRRALAFLTLSWVPLAGATLSLILSVASIIVSTREPAVLLILPDLVRVAQGEDFGYAYMYLQPTFVSTGQNDRVEVIRDITVFVEPAGGGERITFEWAERLELVLNEDRELDYDYAGDAVPLLVSPRQAQAPLGSFQGPDGWYFEAGTYEITVEAPRVVASTPLRGSMEITFSQDAVETLNDAGGNRFLEFPTSSVSDGS